MRYLRFLRPSVRERLTGLRRDRELLVSGFGPQYLTVAELLEKLRHYDRRPR